MDNYMEMISVPTITAVVYIIIELIKCTVGKNEKFKRFIPLLSAAIGGLCGTICYFYLPEIINTDVLLVAIVIGAASGLTATGFNQVLKQLSKRKD